MHSLNSVLFLLHIVLLSFSLSDRNVRQRDTFSNGFVDNYHKLPDQIYGVDKIRVQNAESRIRTEIPAFGENNDLDAINPHYIALAEQSLDKYLKGTHNIQPHKVDLITRVTTQVVSGIITRIDFIASGIDQTIGDTLQCQSEIWEQPWLMRKDIDVNCHNILIQRTTKKPGSETEQNPSKPEYKALATQSLEKYLKGTYNIQPHKVDLITRVTTQVVSGIITRIDFIASGIDQTIGDTLQCHSEIWEQPGSMRKDVDVNCRNILKERTTKILGIGGITEQDQNDPQYKVLAEESIQKYLKKSHNILPYRVVKVLKVTSLLVSGLITRIDFVASLLNPHINHVLLCHSEILDAPWKGIKDFDVKCQNPIILSS